MVIIGGGIIGASIAFRLASQGVKPIVLFEKSALASGATGICPGGIRQQFEGEADCWLARRSMRFWTRINEILEPADPFYFEQSGYLFLADSERMLSKLASHVEMQNRLGIPSRIVSPSQISDLLPALQCRGLAGGSFCAEDGFLEECDRVTSELIRAAQSRTRVLFEEVTELKRDGARWLTRTPHSEWSAPDLVIAAGLETPVLAARLNIRLPIRAELRRLAFTEPCDDPLMLPLVVALERGFAGKQLRHGVFYFGATDESPEMDDLDFLERGLRAGAGLLPVMGELGVRRVLRGEYDNTPDRRPLLGRVEGLPGLHLAVGFSGHGFMIAPAVAEIIEASVTGAETDLPVEAFAVERFRKGGLEREGLVI